MQPLRHFLLAVQFFSRIPITGRLGAWVGWSPAMQRASAAHLPGVGWLVGLWGGLVLLGAGYLFPSHPFQPWVAALLSTVATLALTGGFHEDGLADVADGLGGHLPAERALEVMKDSRLGSYGVMALCLGLLAKIMLVALLADINLGLAAEVLVATHVLSRGAPLLLMRALPHVSLPASSKTVHIAGTPLSGAGLATGLAWCVPAAVLIAISLGGAVLAAMLLTAAVITVYLGWRFHRRLGGMTGDCLGATQQLCELGMYLAVAAALWNGL